MLLIRVLLVKGVLNNKIFTLILNKNVPKLLKSCTILSLQYLVLQRTYFGTLNKIITECITNIN